jgi:hypothetical protein
MTDKRNAVIERLRKVLALAKGGTGGERDNAERQLEAMLRKHGLTMDDIDDETVKKVKVEFHFRNEFEEKLAMQTVSFVLDTYSPEIWHQKGSRSRFHVYITPAEKAQCDYIYEILKPAMMSVLDTAYNGFLIAQKLFPQTAEGLSAKDLSQDELMRLKQASAMSEFMAKEPINKAITNS